MKTVVSIAIILFSLSSFAQEKKDTTVQSTYTLNDFKALLYTIEASIDSKRTAKDILDFIKSHSAIVPNVKPTDGKNPKK